MRTHELDPLIHQLKKNPGTTLILPGTPEYEEARLVYNRMHNAYPKLILRTLHVEDIILTLRYAAQKHIPLAVRGGGHHIAGFGTCDAGIVLDFSLFKHIEIDAEKSIVSVDPGVCLGDLDRFLTARGYIVPTGTVSQTGIAGLTLGGGIGWLIGRYGLTCDQLCGADVLLPNGQLVRAEDPEHHDLLWALRGGGGNFGIVLNFRYHLNPLPKTTCGMGFVSWPDVSTVMTLLLNYLKTCPTSMTVAPVLSKDEQGAPFLRIDFCCADANETEVAQLMQISPLVTWKQVKEWDFAAWQKASDHAFLPPMRGYWKASYFSAFTPEDVNRLCDAFEKAPSARCSILIEHLHGAFKSFGESTSAFPLRHCHFGVLFSARWEDAVEDAENIQWVRQSFEQLDPDARSLTYLNYALSDDQRALHSLLNKTREKMTRIKTVYDPHNFLRQNHNVLPTNHP